MKENVFDVLIYLFENYMDSDVEIDPDSDVVKVELIEAGFPQADIVKALEWLDSLTENPHLVSQGSPSFRVFAEEERARIGDDCLGFLISLEQSGILNPCSRELVIDRVMALGDENLTLENLKWVVLMVLFSRPEEETAFARMESLLYDPASDHYH